MVLLGFSRAETKSRVGASQTSLVTATVHPSSILRAADDESRRAERAAFVRDLKHVAGRLGD